MKPTLTQLEARDTPSVSAILEGSTVFVSTDTVVHRIDLLEYEGSLWISGTEQRTRKGNFNDEYSFPLDAVQNAVVHTRGPGDLIVLDSSLGTLPVTVRSGAPADHILVSGGDLVAYTQAHDTVTLLGQVGEAYTVVLDRGVTQIVNSDGETTTIHGKPKLEIGFGFGTGVFTGNPYTDYEFLVEPSKDPQTFTLE